MRWTYLFLTLLLGSLPDNSASQIITTIAGAGTLGFSGDGGMATAAQIYYPYGVVTDTNGNVFFADYNNHRIRKINTVGVISTVAGNGTGSFSGDGLPATIASMNHPYDVALDKTGNLYFSDQGNQRVRKIDTAGIITTIAGTGTAGYTMDGVPATAAQLFNPDGLEIDRLGNIYIADVGNNRIRKIDNAGIISTIAGTGIAGYSGDGVPATVSQLKLPVDIAVDWRGNIFISDQQNYRIRKVNTSGIITTYAGTGMSGVGGDGGPATAAEFRFPNLIAVDNIGNVYIADQVQNRVRKISTNDTITTIAGTGIPGFAGDGGLATIALLKAPNGVCVDTYGDVYISEYTNDRVRKISHGNHLPYFTEGAVQLLNTCKNAGAASIDTLLYINDVDTAQTITWSLISGSFHGTATASFTSPSIGSTIGTAGLNYTPNPGYSGFDTFTMRVDDGLSVATTAIYVAIPDCSVNVTNTNHSFNSGMQVYPNPGDGSFTVRVHATAEVTITNITGEVLKKVTISANTPATIQLDVPSGVYIIAALSIEGLVNEKLVVVK